MFHFDQTIFYGVCISFSLLLLKMHYMYMMHCCTLYLFCKSYISFTLLLALKSLHIFRHCLYFLPLYSILYTKSLLLLLPKLRITISTLLNYILIALFFFQSYPYKRSKIYFKYNYVKVNIHLHVCASVHTLLGSLSVYWICNLI